MSTRLAIYTDVEKIRSWFNHFHISPSICTLYVINIGPFIYICKNPSSVPTSKHGLFKSKFPLYSPLSWLITAVWEFNILHTINNQGNVCELVKLPLFIQFVQHDFVVRREHASTLHLPLHLIRHDPCLPSPREQRKMVKLNNDLTQSWCHRISAWHSWQACN